LVPSKEPGAARKWVDAMKLGDASAVLALPAVSALAFSTRDGEADREEQSKELEKGITTSLGPRLKEPGKIHDVFESVRKARDESVALSLSIDEPTGLLVRAPVRDAAAADAAIRGVFELAKGEPFKELLRVHDVTSTNDELPGLGRISALTLVREPKETKDGKETKRGVDAGAPRKFDKGPLSSSSGVAWILDQKMLALAAGPEPIVTLKIGAKPERKLADEPSLKRFITMVGNEATTVIVGQPLRLDPKRANLPTAPLAVAVGKKGSDAFVRVDISDGLFRELARWQMGF
ncbi:MAG TPA: hypothetical protein VM925_34210, partial [Labilithrix sp.]|nr:hypothetical protein [Labilithrix sp.]